MTTRRASPPAKRRRYATLAAKGCRMIRWIGCLRQGISVLAAAGRGLLFPPALRLLRRRASRSGRPVASLHRLPGTAGARRHGTVAGGAGARCWRAAFRPLRCLLCNNLSLRFDAAVALGSYHAGLGEVVLRMKRPSRNALSLAMGRLLAEPTSSGVAGTPGERDRSHSHVLGPPVGPGDQ